MSLLSPGPYPNVCVFVHLFRPIWVCVYMWVGGCVSTLPILYKMRLYSEYGLLRIIHSSPDFVYSDVYDEGIDEFE